MKSNMSDVTYFNGNRGLRWSCDARLIEQRFRNPVKAVALEDGSGLLVVEPASNDAPDNAIILNRDGSLRVRIINPEGNNGAICFGDAYYARSELTLIICFSSWQMACVIDGSGEVVRTYETR